MTEPLLTIGDFARAVGLSTSALRHYDECGLLVPAETDAVTGYRYYTPDLERRARLVAMMRDVGVPIETMRAVLDGTPDTAREVLRDLSSKREEEAARTLHVIEAVLATVDVARATTVLVRLRVSGPSLAAALRQVRPAADLDPASPLAAALLDVQGDDVDVVATNRYWMAIRSLRGEAEVRGDARATLRLPDAAALAERLDRADDVVLVLTSGGLVVEHGDDVVSAATSDLPYPAHRLVVGGLAPPETAALVDRDRLVEAVAAAGRAVVEVELGDDVVEVMGAAAVAATVVGKPQALRFRSALLLRAVGACVGDRVRIEVTEARRPVRVTSPDQPGFSALVMPTLEQG